MEKTEPIDGPYLYLTIRDEHKDTKRWHIYPVKKEQGQFIKNYSAGGWDQTGLENFVIYGYFRDAKWLKPEEYAENRKTPVFGEGCGYEDCYRLEEKELRTKLKFI